MSSELLSAAQVKERLSPERAALREQVGELKAECKRLYRLAGETSEIVAAVKDEIKAYAPVTLVATSAKVSKVESPIAMVAHVTDWHIGLVTKASQVEDFGENNFVLAQARLDKFAESLAKWAALHRASYVIDECVVLGTGDWISGDIHDGLTRTNEFPVPVQAVRSGYLLGAFVREMARHFPRVRVEFITKGNHDRLTRKPQAQDGGFNSMGFVVGHIAAQSVSAQKNVTFNIYPESHHVVNVKGQRYLLAHGDGILGTWGIPYYGIERKNAREAMKRMNADVGKHFDQTVIGHFHSAADHEAWLIGGSLTGTDENDHTQGRHSRPHQTAWFVHPKHGKFDWTRWYL